MTAVRVLIVDDSVTMRAMLEQVISADAALQVVGVAADAATAAQLMKIQWPDVMTLDLAMPGTNGLQFLKQIDGARHPPVIVVSSASKAGAPETTFAIEAGAHACFDKAHILADAPGFRRALRKAAQADPALDSAQRGKSRKCTVSSLKWDQ